jgi:IBR domain, a half RING-finger domain
MSSNPKAAPTHNDTALERVRNRLASSPDAKLPLSKLLPRLVGRFFVAATSDDAGPSSAAASRLNLHHLIGILEHVRERCLLNPKLIQLAWIQPLLTAVLPPEGVACNQEVAASWTRQLLHTLPILELAAMLVAHRTVCLLPQLMTIVEGLHTVLPMLWQNPGRSSPPSNRRNNGQDRSNVRAEDEMEMEIENDGDEQAATFDENLPNKQQLHQVWEQVSWIVIEQIAKAFNLSPALDWNLLGDEWDEVNSPSSLKKIQGYEATHEEQASAGSGMFHLILDVISFDPSQMTNPIQNRNNFYGNQDNLNYSRWQFRRQTESIQEDFVLAQRQRIAEHELARRNRVQLVRQDVSRRSNPTEWNQFELQYWRGLQLCIKPYAITLLHDTEREGIFRILTGQLKSPSSLDLYNRIKPSEMKNINARKKAKSALAEQIKPVCSLGEQTALLHLILGDSIARPILQKYTRSGPWLHLDLLGTKVNASVSQCPCIIFHRPLPPVMAQRVFSHLLRADLNIADEHVDDQSLGVFVDLMYQIKTAPSLQVQLSGEVYERIGAHTPPSICWPVHFLWQLTKKLAEDKSCLPAVLCKVGYTAAVELLDKLQDSSVQRYERQVQLAMERGGHQRLIHEHREKQSNRHPFVLDALQARSEAYQMVTRFMTKDNVMRGKTVISWDQAVRMVNCVAFDLSEETSISIRETSVKVISFYRQVLTEQGVAKTQADVPPINPLLLPLLKACISASEWSREVAINWAVEIIYQLDPCISQTILSCLLSDEVPHVARKATDALRILSFQVMDSAAPSMAAIHYLNLEHSKGRIMLAGDLQSRILSVTGTHSGLSTKEAYQALQNFNFSVEAASKALADNRKVALSRIFKHAQEEVSMDVYRKERVLHKALGGFEHMDLDPNDNSTCQVCWDEVASSEGFSLLCGHMFCRDCWRSGLEAVAGSPTFKELAAFSCLRHDCDERMTQEDVKEVAPKVELAFENATLKWFVLSSVDYAFCPGPDCSVIASRCGFSNPQQADCQLCRSSFCFDCGNEPHAPASCHVKKRYVTASERVKAHEDDVEHKIIACPNCSIGITKNGGCNHMTCSQCGHEFCWICLSANWQDHVCNVYDSLTGVSDLQRLQFFRRRVETHLMSSEATQRILSEFDELAQELKSRSRFCQDSHLYILKEALEMGIKGRKYLANSYIAAYGMDSTFDASVRQEFESHQSQLQLFVEQLSFLSDDATGLYRIDREQDFRVRFRGLHFCTVAVSGYIARVDSCVGPYFQEKSPRVSSRRDVDGIGGSITS